MVRKDMTQVSSDMQCGIGPCKPEFMQCCARVGVFTGAYSVSALFTSVLGIYVGSQITAIEKQFGLSSAQSGLLLSCNDFGFLLTTLFFSYIARKVHIPRVICLSAVLYGLAGFICAVPYFVSRDYVMQQSRELFADTSVLGTNYSYDASKSNVPMCHELNVLGPDIPRDNATSCEATDTDDFGVGKPNRYTKVAIALIAAGMVLQGIGKAPRSPFLTTYIEDNGKKKNTAMYLGVITGLAIFGPALAFTTGSYFSRVYVTLEDVPLSPRHPAWIGAWWLGFLVFGFTTIVMTIPIFLFPRRMKPKPIGRSKTSSGKPAANVKGFLTALKRLFTNPVYLPIQINSLLQSIAYAGVASFYAKYFETQFFIPAWKANILLGLGIVIAAAVGSFLGGILVTKLKMSPVACIKFVMGIYLLHILKACLGFVMGCPNADIAGFNIDNNFDGTNTSCSTACGCDSVTYFPVCGSNNVNFMSPCHAGCSSQKGMEFYNCTCIGPEVNSTATAGLCDTSCTMLYPYVVLNAVSAFIATFGIIPGFIVSIRSVSEEDKPLSIGFSSVVSTIAWLTGSILFGRIIDGTCLLWSSSCSGGGACALYDNDVFRFRLHIAQVVPAVVGTFMLVFIFIQARKKTDWSSEEQLRVGDEVEAQESMLDDNLTSYKRNRPIYKQ